MNAVILCALVSVAPPPAPTFDEVIFVPGENNQISLLYVVITEDWSGADRLAEIAVQYASAALREAKRLTPRDNRARSRSLTSRENPEFDGSIVFAVRSRPHERTATVTGFTPRQLREIATAKTDKALKLAGRHTWGLSGKLP
jgi:hypothetical protein